MSSESPGEHLRIAVREFVDFENALAAEIEQFRALRPDIVMEAVPMDLASLHRELFAAGGLRSGKWDLALLVTDWLSDAVQGGLLADLGPCMAAEPLPDWPQGWPRSLVEPLDFEGAFYCIPWHDGPECLIYRRDLFESPQEQQAFRAAFGYPLAPPKSWQQFEDVARFFTRPHEGIYGTLFACYPDGHNTLYDFALQLWSRGGELHDSDGQPTLVTPQAAEALDSYRRVVRDAAICHPGSRDFDSVRAGEEFLSGSTAMMVNWFGFAARSGRPGSSLAGRVALAPVPAGEGLPHASLSVFWTMAIAAGSQHKQHAFEFLRFLASPEIDREVVRHGVVGVRLSTWRDPEVQRLVPAFEHIEGISLGARRLPRTASLPEFAEVVNGIVERALRSEEPSLAILQRAQQEALERKIRFL